MKIVKYLLLISLLLLLGFSVFVATLPADFKITKSKIINTPKSTLIAYVSDLRNWENFVFLESKETKYSFTKKNNLLSWQNQNDFGTIASIKSNEKNTLVFQSSSETDKTYQKWFFKDTIGGTKVTWKNEGEASFSLKIKSIFRGGIAAIMGNKIEIGLENLNKALNFEINTFSIKTDGIVAIDSSFCIQKTILCEEKNLRKNISILLPNLLSFFERNGLQQQEAPYASYFTTNESKKIVKLTIGVHVSDSIKLSPNSYYQFVGNKNSKAVKTILKGDFSHLQTAKDSLFAYTDKNKIVLKYPVEIIEKYIVSKKDTKKQSEWTTEIMVSVLEKPKYKRVKRPEGDTTREPGQLPTTENIVPIKEPSTN